MDRLPETPPLATCQDGPDVERADRGRPYDVETIVDRLRTYGPRRAVHGDDEPVFQHVEANDTARTICLAGRDGWARSPRFLTPQPERCRRGVFSVSRGEP